RASRGADGVDGLAKRFRTTPQDGDLRPEARQTERRRAAEAAAPARDDRGLAGEQVLAERFEHAGLPKSLARLAEGAQACRSGARIRQVLVPWALPRNSRPLVSLIVPGLLSSHTRPRPGSAARRRARRPPPSCRVLPGS